MRIVLPLVLILAAACEPSPAPADTDDTDPQVVSSDACSGEAEAVREQARFVNQTMVDRYCETLPDRVHVAALEVEGVEGVSLAPLSCVCATERVEITGSGLTELTGPDLSTVQVLRIEQDVHISDISIPGLQSMRQLDLQGLEALEHLFLPDLEEIEGSMSLYQLPRWDRTGLPRLSRAGQLSIQGPLGEGTREDGPPLVVERVNIQDLEAVDLDDLPCIDADELSLFNLPNLRDATLGCTDTLDTLEVRDLPSLETLARQDITVTDTLRLRDAPSLRSLGETTLAPSLRAVSLWSMPDFDGSDQVLGQPGLEQLLVLDTPVDLEAVTSWDRLVDLTLQDADRIERLDKPMPAASRVQLRSLPALTDISGVGSAGTLVSLTLDDLAQLDDITPLHALDGIHWLEVSDTPRLTSTEIQAFLDAVPVEDVRRMEP